MPTVLRNPGGNHEITKEQNRLHRIDLHSTALTLGMYGDKGTYNVDQEGTQRRVRAYASKARPGAHLETRQVFDHPRFTSVPRVPGRHHGKILFVQARKSCLRWHAQGMAQAMTQNSRCLLKR